MLKLFNRLINLIISRAKSSPHQKQSHATTITIVNITSSSGDIHTAKIPIASVQPEEPYVIHLVRQCKFDTTKFNTRQIRGQMGTRLTLTPVAFIVPIIPTEVQILCI